MIRIGTSGWSYDHWTDVLYPTGMPVAARLARYAEEFDTVELNASFYCWPRDATFAGWSQRLPVGFTMSVKAHRGLTHFRRLRSPQPWIERFDRCWTALGDRAEALLVQTIRRSNVTTTCSPDSRRSYPRAYRQRWNYGTRRGTIPRSMNCLSSSARVMS